MSMVHHFCLIQSLATEAAWAGDQPVWTGIDAGSGSFKLIWYGAFNALRSLDG
jgi:hypothetical protein